MELLKEYIRKYGVVRPGNILKVDSFLNHQMDIALLNRIGEEFKNIFADKKITKILTIEASGIGIACIVAQYFNVPVVFAKKSESLNLDGDLYTSKCFSFTKNREYTALVSKKYILPDDNILLIDDFLANGRAMLALIDIVNQSKAKIAGAGIVIEKGFQEGGKLVRDAGVQLESLVVIDSMSDSDLVFRE